MLVKYSTASGYGQIVSEFRCAETIVAAGLTAVVKSGENCPKSQAIVPFDLGSHDQ